MEGNVFAKLVDKFRGKHIGVIGDLILDKFVYGDTERISPEAPIPVVLVSKEFSAPGGAGNVANNIAALGGKAFISGLIGEDESGAQLIQELKKRGIDVRGVVTDEKMETIQKVRVIARGQHVVRIDKESIGHTTRRIEEAIYAFVNANIDKWDGIVISDYAKGFITKPLTQKIIGLANTKNTFVIGDTKPVHAPYFKNVFLLAPNLKEAKEIAGVDDVNKAGKNIQRQFHCNVLITEGSRGMTLFEAKKVHHFPAKAKEVFDVAGAGDTVVAVIALSLASGSNLEQATVIANHAAGIVVGKIGTATVSTEELKSDLLQNG